MFCKMLFRDLYDAEQHYECFARMGAFVTPPSLCPQTKFWLVWVESELKSVPDEYRDSVVWH